MIVTELYNGQGLGNQLWTYLTTRIISFERGYEFGIQSSHKFKGREFMDINFGLSVEGGNGPEGGPPISLPDGITNYYKEKIIRHTNGVDISKYDEGLFSILDNTKIDGNMQSFDYVKNHRDLIKSWIVLKDFTNINQETNYDVCVVHIRGGDFRYSSAFLDKSYYDNAMSKMLERNSNMKFVIVTDDIGYSRAIYPNIPIIGGSSTNLTDSNKAGHHNGGPIWMDWMILSNAKNVIMSASSFSFWPVYLNDDVYVIAPMYWGDYNRSDGYWSCGDSIIDNWNYINKFGELLSSDKCVSRRSEYEKINKFYENI